MIFDFMQDVKPPVNLGTDIDEIRDKLFKLEISSYDEYIQMAELELSEECVTLSGANMPYKILKPAFDQWLTRAKIPLAYAYDIPFDMLYYNVSRRSKQKNRQLLVRTRNCGKNAITLGSDEHDVIRAILTEKYHILNNSQCFHEFKEVICWADMSITESSVSEKMFRAIASGESKIDDDIATGLEMVNGETGWCSLELNTVLKTKKTYMIVADTQNTTKFNLKMVHLQKDIKAKMQEHARSIIENLDLFKTYVDNAKKIDMKVSDIMKVKDRMDIIVGRPETRELVEQLENKNKFQAAELLAEYGDDITDQERQRLTKICAGSLLMS